MFALNHLLTMRTLCVFIGCILTWSQGIFSSQVRIDPVNPFVLPGRNLSILCQADEPLLYCRIKVGGFKNALYLSPKTTPTKEFAYYGDGLDKGQCGITLFNVVDKANGVIECTPLLDTGVSEESSAKTNVTVIRSPKRPELVLTRLGAARSPGFKEDDVLQASCSVKDGRPLANITWYLDDDVIRNGIKSYVSVDEHTDLRSVTQAIVRKITWKENGRVLRCLAGHPALISSYDVSKKLNVTYVPKSLTNSLEFYGLKLNEMQNITVEIFANPRPTFTWMIGKNTKLTDGQHHSEGNLVAQWPEHLGGDKWKVALQIQRLTKADVDRQYRLVAKNSEGHKAFDVLISTDDGPAFKLGMGSYILMAIVGVCVLTVGVTLFIVVSQRRKRKLVIAPTSTEKITKLEVES